MAWVSAHRWPLLAAVLVAAAVIALGVATYRPGWLPGRTGDVANRVASSIGQQAGEAGRTVASLFDMRSPGERVGGALASLKGAKRPLLHERALPKVRRPLSPLAAIVAAPPVPPVVPAAPVPLYNVVAPKPPPATGFTPAPGGPPVVFPGVIPPPGGGGGGVIVPPPITTTPPPVTPVVPITPTTPGVPEPASWAMMLLGFAMIGWAVRRRTVRVALA